MIQEEIEEAPNDDSHQTEWRVPRSSQASLRPEGMTQTGYLASLGTDQARRELREHAVREYLEGKASLSELARKTGLDVPTIMEAIAPEEAEEKRAIEGFLKAAKTLAETHSDPEFSELARRAVAA